MGTYRTEVWLSLSHPSGRPIPPDTLTQALGGDPSLYVVGGLNERWANARLDVCLLHLEDFADQEEPTEAFAAATRNALIEFALWLTRLSVSAFDELRGDSFKTEVWVYCWIEQDQFELILPPELLVELGRLRLPIQMMTEGQ